MIIKSSVVLLVALTATVLLETAQASAEFQPEVKPACPPESKVCEFTWHLSRHETLVKYDFERSKGFPLLIRNDSYYLRQPDDCNVLEKANDQDVLDTITTDGIHRYVYTINNNFPGPSIVVYEGQQVKVKITNGLLQEGTTIHWHGMFQRRSNFMDGTASVTQCIINPGETFTYRFIAQPAGTHWYHSHFGLQRSDGINGALIVLPRNKTNPNVTHDSSSHNPKIVKSSEVETTPQPTPSPFPKFEKEFIMLIHDWFHEESNDIFVSYYSETAKFLWDGYNNTDDCHTRTQQLDGGEVGTVPFQSALINGRGQFYGKYEKGIPVPYSKFHVQKGKYYRFRSINTGMNFALRISVDQHQIHIISSDGMDLQEVVADSIVVHSGERYDFYIYADKDVDSYIIEVATVETNTGRIADWDTPAGMIDPGFTHAILQYEGAPDVIPPSRPKECTPDKKCVMVNCPFKEFPDTSNETCINFDELKALEPNNIGQTKSTEEMFLNFHFPFGIGDLLRSQVNGIQFQAPSTPPVVTSNVGKFDNPCDIEKCNKEPCHCTYTVNITTGNEIYMVLTSTVTDIEWEGLPATVHPVHLHGHHFQVVKVGYAELKPDTKRYHKMNPDIRCTNSRCNEIEWANPSWKNGNIPGMNLENPPLKDTVTVPVGGYVVIRFKSDNPGWWIMHCHVELHQVEGMALIVREGEADEMNRTPPGFPTCGTFDISEEEFDKLISSGQQTIPSVLIVSLIAFISSMFR